MKTFAEVSWSPSDVLDLAPQLTEKQAEEFLERNQKHIASDMVQRGWESLEAMLQYEDITTKETS